MQKKHVRNLKKEKKQILQNRLIEYKNSKNKIDNKLIYINSLINEK